MSEWLVALLAALPLFGVVLGAAVTYCFESWQWKRNRADRRRERIRDAYAEWIGTLLKEVAFWRRLLATGEWNDESKLDRLRDVREQEQVAWTKVMLVDSDKSRTKAADEIRSPLDKMPPPAPALAKIGEVIKGFLRRVRDEINE